MSTATPEIINTDRFKKIEVFINGRKLDLSNIDKLSDGIEDFNKTNRSLAQLGEHLPFKQNVMSSILIGPI